MICSSEYSTVDNCGVEPRIGDSLTSFMSENDENAQNPSGLLDSPGEGIPLLESGLSEVIGRGVFVLQGEDITLKLVAGPFPLSRTLLLGAFLDEDVPDSSTCFLLGILESVRDKNELGRLDKLLIVEEGVG